jgi:hypothetical protein
MPSKGTSSVGISLNMLLFQEPWWLEAVTGGDYAEAVVKHDTKVVGRLPYVRARRGPFQVSRMPSFTHLLGPVVDAGEGKPQTRLANRMAITRSLIDQLPPFALIEQYLDPSMDDGLALADGLAFQDKGFFVATQYTFEVDCKSSLENLWSAMHYKTRNPIRRAEEKYSVRAVDDPSFFTHTYLSNLAALGKKNRVDLNRFPPLFCECQSRHCGEIIGAFGEDGRPLSMAFLVWDKTRMYYLLATRSASPEEYGSAGLLVWNAIKKANALGLRFDLDGVYTRGTAKFLSGFGGRMRIRLVVKRTRPLYRALQQARLRFTRNETQFYT